MKSLALLAALALPLAAQAQTDPADWDAVTAAAKGQTVYWNAWGGSTTTNDFIAWVGDKVKTEYGVTLEHVKLTDTADAVTRVLSEKQAGTDTGGAIDLIWINGANFAAMKEADLLFGPFAEQLPNWRYVDTEGKTVQTDFTVPVDGYESPWAMAQVVFIYDSAKMEPLGSMQAILDWSTAHPGRFTYPQPPDFLGTTFLKQVLVDTLDDPSVLQQPATDENYAQVTASLWDYLDKLTPSLWREGRAYPATGTAMFPLIADGEIDLSTSFSPGAATAAIANNELPETVRTFVLDKGTIGNASFVAIPYNAAHAEGAMIVANALLSPEAQARAQDPEILGYGTVLAMDKLDTDQRALFDALDLGVATLSPEELGTVQAEPHPSWMTRIADDWNSRYGVAQ
ncbi:putative thiamine transport system substrate-binding protein [Loktanella atrilutea]|uniref:Putative thiamine transport system substrate-binding protein n=1 Tax=Loktanella atrilutea TaxID=366533 RepID=A0A1M5C9G9_LOKAT|nr:ABC transporter substrate-binding protein [Loktanella atrilutea]SHF51393.1 putative thiamine transport system substrate-binding protein [Loktanella atrilutea]